MAQNTITDTVAKAATERVDGHLSGLLLIGTFGTDAARRALLRLPGGDTETVGVGDHVEGDRVVAIDTGRIALAQGSTARWITMP